MSGARRVFNGYIIRAMTTPDLFELTDLTGQPLADRMRPQCLDDYAGQDHILAPGKPLRTAIETARLHSMILWGPGCWRTPQAIDFIRFRPCLQA